jgi:hypothetical protein
MHPIAGPGDQPAARTGHSWYPVCRGSLDVVGVVNAAKLLALRGIQAANACRCFKFGSAPDRIGPYAVPAVLRFRKRCPAWSFWSSFAPVPRESSGGR